MARPNLSYLKSVFLTLFGLPVGLLTGLTAMGGSVVLIPGIRWLLGLHPLRAAATALAVTFFAALAGLLSYSQHASIRLGLALALALGQIIGAGWGAHLVERAPALIRLRLLWAVLVIASGLALAAQGRDLLPVRPWLSPLSGLGLWSMALAVALAVGLVSRVIELGGVLLVPAAIELLHLPPHTAQGTALVVLLLASLPGMLIHAQRGNLEPQATIWLSFGAALGALVGAFWANQIQDQLLLLTIYGLVLTLLGLTMLWRREANSSQREAVEPPSRTGQREP